MTIIIPGTLPAMNEIVAASKKHWSEYAEMKRTYTGLVAMVAGRLPPIQRSNLIITWYCKDKRRDKDNVMAGQKFIFDGLMAAGKLTNDGWKQIGEVTHRFEVDKQHPRVEVEIVEVSASGK